MNKSLTRMLLMYNLHIAVVNGVVYGLEVTYMVSFLLVKIASLEFPPLISRINDFGAQH